MTEKVIAIHRPEKDTIWAGYEHTQPPYPPKRDVGFFVSSEIEVIDRVVTGYMHFPQRGYFEYRGTIDKFCKALKAAGGARAVFSIEDFTWWMY